MVDISKSVVAESAAYDNFLNKREEMIHESKLPIEVNFDEQKERDKLWVGMPEFVQEDKATFKTIYLHFRNEEDFKEFVDKYKTVDTDQNITKKTKSMWYPHLNKDENSLKRWFEQ